LAGFQLPYMFPYITVYYHMSREIHAAPGSVQDPGNTFSSGRAAPDRGRSGAKHGGPLM